jgi:hypothetical protein
VIVPVYVPATCDVESVKVMVGFQLAELLPVPAAREKAVPEAERLVRTPGVNVPRPVVAVASPAV